MVKGKTGKVLKVFSQSFKSDCRRYKFKKKTLLNRFREILQGGILEKESPIHVSNVMLIDPKTDEPTRSGAQIILDRETR